MSTPIDETAKAIFTAIDNNDLATFRTLTADSADSTCPRPNPEAPNEAGFTVLERAVILNRPEIVQDLCHKGANTKPRGPGPTRVPGYNGSLICYAARHALNDVIRALLSCSDNKPFINEREYGPDSDTPLSIAIRAQHPRTTICLLRNGADPNIEVRGWGTPLGMVVRQKFKGEAEVLRPNVVCELLDAGADINQPAHWPPFAAALDCEREKSYDTIINAMLVMKPRPDFNFPGMVPMGNTAAVTALTMAIDRRLWDIAGEILARGGTQLDVNKGNPLALAVSKGADGENMVGILMRTKRLNETSYRGAVERAIRMKTIAANSRAHTLLKEWATFADDMKSELAKLKELAVEVHNTVAKGYLTYSVWKASH